MSYIALVSIKNVTNVTSKLISVYVLMTVVYSVLAFTFIFFYWKKSMSWRYKKHSHTSTFSDHDVALHSLMIKNLPKDVPVAKMSERIKSVFERIFPEAKVVSARATPRLDSLYSMALKLKEFKKTYRY